MARDPYTDPRRTDPVGRALTEREKELGVYDKSRSDYDRADARDDIRRGHESLAKSEGYDARGNRAGDAYTPRDRRPRDVAYAESEAGYGGPATNDPDQLQDEIELLQNRMAARLDRVTQALTPQNMIAQVTGEKNPDIFTTIDTIADAARRNPLAAGLIGSGLAALVMGSRKPRYEPEPERLERARAAYGVEGVTADGTRFAPSGVEGGAVRYEDDTYPHDPLYAGNPDEPRSAEEAEQRVKALQDVTAARLDRATNAFNDAYERGRASVMGTYERVRSRFSSDDYDDGYERPGPMDWVRENPVTLGLGALALGALAAGYYTSSRPTARRTARKPLPSDRSLMVRDDYRSVEDEYVRDGETGAPIMPVSAAAPAPMGSTMTRTAPIGGSGQMETSTPTGVAALGTGAATTGASTGTGSTTGTGSMGGSSSRSTSPASTPKEGDTAEEIVRRNERKTSGAGFGSTAASRGEVASKPLAEMQNTTAREGSTGSTPPTKHDAKSTDTMKSADTKPLDSKSPDTKSSDTKPTDTSTGSTSSNPSASGSGSGAMSSTGGGASGGASVSGSSERTGTGASATDRTLNRMSGDTETSPSPRERDHPNDRRSNSTVEMTDIYRREG